MNQQLSNVLKLFGLEASRLRKPSDAMLAQVYFVEDQYILRSRPYEADTPVRFDTECNLCGQVAELTGYRFPEYLQCASGDRFVVDKGYFWTLHKIIPGHPLGSWFELHRIDPSVHHKVLGSLRRLHTLTTGTIDEKFIDRRRLIDLITPSMDEARSFLSGQALDRLGVAFESVKSYCDAYPPGISCFVHGDFHHGNILAKDQQISGFIDLDWCRAGSFYEDFAFTLMMMMRDYKNWSHEFSWSMYRSILDDYDFKGDAELLNDHLILYALFDCTVFNSSNFENSNAFFKYQKQFLESVCRAT